MKILEDKSIAFEFVNVRKTPINEKQLKTIVASLGMEAVFNKKGSTYRRLGLNYDQMSDQERFENIATEQSMIRRPLLEKDGRYHIGFDEAAIIKFVI